MNNQSNQPNQSTSYKEQQSIISKQIRNEGICWFMFIIATGIVLSISGCGGNDPTMDQEELQQEQCHANGVVGPCQVTQKS